MTKTTTRLPFPKILKLIQFLNYASVVIGLFAVSVYLFASSEDTASFNNDIVPLNQYVVAVLYFMYTVLIGVAAYVIRKRKSYAPYVFVLAMFVTEPLSTLIDHYSNYTYEGDMVMVIGLTISYIFAFLAMTYMLFNKQVRKIFVEK